MCIVPAVLSSTENNHLPQTGHFTFRTIFTPHTQRSAPDITASEEGEGGEITMSYYGFIISQKYGIINIKGA